MIGVTQADATLDIRGEVCPYTYVKTRLALEDMQPGQVLRVYLDYEPATRSVPKSVRIAGDEVLSLAETQPGEWEILVRKRVNESANRRINEW
jgi:TusA-related sulfurtransferase